MESSLCEKPERHASRRLSDLDQVGQPRLTDPFSPDLAKPFMKAECGKTARSV